MRSNHFRVIGIALLSSLLALNGCLGGPGKTPPTKYYILNSSSIAENDAASVAILKDATVGVGPIKLSQVLDRPQIIMRTSKNEIRIADLERQGAKALELGLVDGIGNLHTTLRERFGDDVIIKTVDMASAFSLRKLMGGRVQGSIDHAAGTAAGAAVERAMTLAEERALWSRYGL